MPPEVAPVLFVCCCCTATGSVATVVKLCSFDAWKFLWILILILQPRPTIQKKPFLQVPMALAPAPLPRLRIVHLSDTHQYDIDAVARIPDDTDLIIHTGDFTNRGR